jgi:hypothetical protein
MPEYLAPGVYVEEVSFRSKSIEGVSTTTTGFVGATCFGPISGVPELLTSLSDFERIYGGLDYLMYEDVGESINFSAQSVRAYFENGGQLLYVSRLFKPSPNDPPPDPQDPEGVDCSTGQIQCFSSPLEDPISLRARYPGVAGDISLIFTVHVGQNVLAGVPHDPSNPSGPKDPVLRGVNDFDLVWIQQNSVSPPGAALYWAENYFDSTLRQWLWRFHPETGSPLSLASTTSPPATGLVPGVDVVKLVTVSVEVNYPGVFPRSDIFQNLTFHPDHPNSLSKFFAVNPASREHALTLPLVFDPKSDLPDNGPMIARIMLTQPPTQAEIGRLNRLLFPPAFPPTSPPSSPPSNFDYTILGTLGYTQLANSDRQFTIALSGGSDGNRPGPDEYEGRDIDPKAKTGLKALEDLSDIAIVAAPGYSAGANDPAHPEQFENMLQITTLLIAHAENMRYRIAVLDAVDGSALSDVRNYRSQLDSKYAALYYPWVTILDPVTQTEINLPPGGFVAGIYADNDILYGVHKAPANMVVKLAIGFEFTLNKGQQEVLNPEGINCFRFFENRGYRLWGARTISSDTEWMYVNLRRYFNYLEHSVDLGTQWVVFENNDPQTWSLVEQTVAGFLRSEWQAGHLVGAKPEQAYFVRCDNTTMTQADIENGRLIVLIGASPVFPAEFVIFRIGQWVGTQA